MDIPQSAAQAAPKRDHPTIWAVDDVLWAELEPVLRVDKPPARNPDGPAATTGRSATA